jgi:hypothetical protein
MLLKDNKSLTEGIVFAIGERNRFKKYIIIIEVTGWAQVAHACNPSYSGVRNQEDQGLKPAQANSLQDPISKNPSQK